MFGKTETSGVNARTQFYFFFAPHPVFLLRFHPQQRNNMTHISLDNIVGCTMPVKQPNTQLPCQRVISSHPFRIIRKGITKG